MAASSTRRRALLRRSRRVSARGACALVLGLAVGLHSGCNVNDGPVALGAPADPAAGKAAPLVAPNWVAEPRQFAAGVQITSFIATPARLLGATIGAAPSKLVSLSENGTITAFASDFALRADLPCALAASPISGSWAEGSILAGAGSEIWQLTDDGALGLLHCTLPEGGGSVLDLCFDTVGSQGLDLLALTSTGALFRIGSNGHAIHLGDAGPHARAITIASNRFAAFAGRILAAFPADSEVRAMDAGGNWTHVTYWSGISSVRSIPDDPRVYGNSNGAVFMATAGGQVQRFAGADIAGRGGQVVLTSTHASGSGLIVPAGSGFSVRPFSRFVGAEVALGAVCKPQVQRVSVDIWPGVAPDVQSIVFGSPDLIPVVVLSGIGFSPASLQGGELRLAGATPVPVSRRSLGSWSDVNADGILDLVLSFRAADMQLAPGQCTLQFDGTALAGDRIRGSDRVLVVEP